MTDPSIFKAYDIRGIYGQGLDDDTAYRLGLAYASMRKGEMPGKARLQIVVGSDMRVSSPALKSKLIDGLLDGGVDVVDIGLASTPTFYFGVAHFAYDGGVLVSASHNPAEYNGFKLVRSKALPVSKDTGILQLRDMVAADGAPLSEWRASEKGELSTRMDVLAEQAKHDLAFGNPSRIKPLKIAIDPANSMGISYFDELFKYLPQCELIKMNWELDGTFPAHEADPFKEENLVQLCARIKETGADIGISTDGDGDRIFFVDNEGMPIQPGITRAILCKIFLEQSPGSKICYDIRPGRITYDTIIENGGIPIVTKVGHSLIKEQTIKEDAVFAGESSGHFFLNMGAEGCYEVPMIVTLKILEELTAADMPLSDYIKPFQRYFHSGEINTRVSDTAAKIEEIKRKYSDGKLNDMDGITIEYDDYWFNLRGSNTEPLLRFTLEAKSQEIMEARRDEILALIRG